MSDVINEYFKLAIEKGWVKEGESSTEKPAKNKDYADTVKALYGIDINDSKKHIMEEAHPKSVVVAPAYDRLNALVENNIERQNVMVDIATKPANGILSQHKYAEQNLIENLVRIGFEAEQSGNAELRKLADNCLIDIVKNNPTNKTAAAPIAAGGAAALLLNPYVWAVVGVAALGYAAKNHFIGYISTGLQSDADRAIKSLTDGLEYADENTKRVLNSAIKLISNYVTLSDSAREKMLKLPSDIDTSMLSNPEELQSVISGVKSSKDDLKFIQQYYVFSQQLVDMLSEVIVDLQSRSAQYSKDSWVAQNEWFNTIWQGSTAFLGTSGFKDQINALSTLKYSIGKMVTEANTSAVKKRDDISQKMQEAVSGTSSISTPTIEA